MQNHKGQGSRDSQATLQTSLNGWTSISMSESGSGTHLGKMKIQSLGTWLGVPHKIGSALCYWVIDVKGSVFSQTTVQHVIVQDLKSDDIK